MLAFEFAHPDHLTNEEVDYELFIRGKIDEITDDEETNYGLLRRLFWEDAKTGRVYDSPYTIDQEYDHIYSIIEQLRGRLAKGFDERDISRLKHYWQRVVRIWTYDQESELMRQELLDEIWTELSRFDSEIELDKGNHNGNLEKQEEAHTTQRQLSDREKALEARVNELEWKLEFLLKYSVVGVIDESALDQNDESSLIDESEILKRDPQQPKSYHNFVFSSATHSPCLELPRIEIVLDSREDSSSGDTCFSEDPCLKLEQKKKMPDDIKSSLNTIDLKQSVYLNVQPELNSSISSVRESVLKDIEKSDKGKKVSTKLASKYIPAVVKWVVGSQCFDFQGLEGERPGIFLFKFRKKITRPSSWKI